MASHKDYESDDSPDKRLISIPDTSRPWLSPITHTARSVLMPDEKCHKTLEESLLDTQRHAGFGGDSGELDESHPDAGHEALEKPAQEKAESAFRKGEKEEHGSY